MGAKSAPKTTKWGQKAPPHKSEPKKCGGQKVPSKCKSGGKKRRQNSKVTAKSATTQIRVKKSWWRKVPSKWKSCGGKRHHISNCGGILTTTYYIQGAGAPAKTENYVNADAFIFFREKVRPFPHLAKSMQNL